MGKKHHTVHRRFEQFLYFSFIWVQDSDKNLAL